jgi:hypothetical protein
VWEAEGARGEDKEFLEVGQNEGLSSCGKAGDKWVKRAVIRGSMSLKAGLSPSLEAPVPGLTLAALSVHLHERAPAVLSGRGPRLSWPTSRSQIC